MGCGHLPRKSGFDSSIWLIPSEDAYVNFTGEIPPLIGYRDENTNAFVEDSAWKRPVPVAYSFAIRVSGNAPASTTPLAWTRGLGTSGQWSADSPWGFGGHIVYLDAPVVFYDELDENSTDGDFLIKKNGDPTANIKDIHVDNIVEAEF